MSIVVPFKVCAYH